MMNKRVSKTISVIMAVIMVLSVYTLALGVVLVRDNAYADNEVPTVSFDGGDGSEDNPFLIANSEQLTLLSNIVNGVYGTGDDEIVIPTSPNSTYITYNGLVSAHYKLVNDISINMGLIESKKADDTGNITDNSGLVLWVPIGNGDRPFKGTFDGNGKTISGLFAELVNYERNAGLFGKIENAYIFDVTVEDSYCYSVYYTGLLVGYAISSSIDNCHADGYAVGNNSSEPSCAGSLVGRLDGGTISNSSASGIARSHYPKSNCGGIVGQLNGEVINCSFNGKIAVQNISIAGGIVGDISEGSRLINCYVICDVIHGNAYTQKEEYLVGGLVGIMAEGVNTTITNCYYSIDTIDESSVFDCASYQRLNVLGTASDYKRTGNIDIWQCDSFDKENALVDHDASEGSAKITLLLALNEYVMTNNQDETNTQKLLTWTTDDSINNNYPVAQYTYTFDQNGHGEQTQPRYVARGQSFTRPSYESVVGWTFDGWYYDGIEVDNGFVINKSITLTAEWIQKIEQLVDNNYHIVMDNEIGFEAGWTTDVLKQEKSQIDSYNTIYFPAQIGYKATVYEAYSIGILDGAIEVKDIGTITISIPLNDSTKSVNQEELGVVVIDKYNKATLLSATVQGEKIVFEVDTSIMPISVGVVQLKSISLWWIWLIVGIVAVVGVVVTLIILKKKGIIKQREKKIIN